jgi:hypothetical protein
MSGKIISWFAWVMVMETSAPHPTPNTDLEFGARIQRLLSAVLKPDQVEWRCCCLECGLRADSPAHGPDAESSNGK